MSEEKNNSSRRGFLEKIALLGAGAAAGSAVLYSGLKYEKAKSASSKIHVLTSDNKVVEIDESAITAFKVTESLQLHGREGIEGKKWVMVVDLAKCQNARKCVKSCQNAHDLRPEQFHMQVLQIQDSPDTAPYNMPKPCQHCDNPPCVSVCPVDATFKRQDGIVLIDNERCIGCRFCMAACPYSSRVFNWLEPIVADDHKGKPYDVELNVPQKKGTISKCLFSADRLRIGKLPYCTEACPNGVYWFGDQNEDIVTNGTTHETRRFSELIAQNGGYNLMPELGTKPRVYYLPAKNRTAPFKNTDDPIEKQEG